MEPSILHVDGGRYWGGGQNQVRLLMRELARAGVRQLCLCPEGSPLQDRLRAEGLPVAAIHWRRGSDPAAFLAIARHLGGWDLIHCHDAHALQLALLPARLAGRPIIGVRRVCFRTRRLKWNLATRVVAISGPVRRTLVESGVREGRIRTIYSGVDLEELAVLPAAEPSLRGQLGLAPEVFLAGNIGTLLEFKNQVLIPAAAAAAPAVQWVIIGEGPERGRIEAAIASHEVAERVHLTGRLPDARRYLSELDVFVFTSNDEALGTSLLDAMGRGIPVVAAADAGPAEVLKPVHADTGASLYRPDDPGALAAAVERVRGDTALAERMVARQRERLQDYRIQKTAAAVLDLYREIAR